ncbi:MAG: hypothetical protein ACOCUT_02310 [bacterium]
MAESIVVKAKIKEVATDSNVAGDFADALNEALLAEVAKAETRAKENGRKTAQTKDVFVGDLVTEPMLVVKSKAKAAVSDVNTSGDFADALNTVAIQLVRQAAAKASANSRKTVQAKDL